MKLQNLALTIFIICFPLIFNAQWYWQRPYPSYVTYNGSCFVGNDRGWIVGNSGVVVWTDDGGENWHQVYTPALVTLNDVHFINTQKGFVVGDDGNIFISTSGGEIFHSLPVSPAYSDKDFYSVYFNVNRLTIFGF